MEAVAEADTVAEAELRHGEASSGELRDIGSAGHKDDALAGELQSGDGLPILLRLNNELEPRALCGAECSQHLRAQAERGVIAGVRELRGDIPLVHALRQGGRGGKGTVGLHLHIHIRRQQGEQLLQLRSLQQGLATGEHQAGAVVAEDALRELLRSQLHPGSPAMLGITPFAVQIAAGKAHKHGGAAGAGSLPLQ